MIANTHSIDLELGSDQFLTILDASQTGLDLAGDFTFATWWKPEDTGVSHALITKGNYNSNTRAYTWIWRTGTNLMTILISSDGGATRDDVSFSFTPIAGTMYHLAMTCDISNAASTEFEFFVNAVSQGNGSVVTDSSVGAIYDSADPFYIGAENGVVDSEINVDGLMDETVVTSDILTLAEITRLYQGYDARFLDNLKGYWKYNNDLTDSSGNGNTLTNNGTAVFSTTVPFANYYGSTGGFIHSSS